MNIQGSMLFLLLAFASGVLMAVQGSINGALGKVIGTMEGNFIVHLFGLIIIAILLFLFKVGDGDFSQYSTAPWWSYLGGAMNVAIIYCVMASIPKIGATNATTAIIVGQVGMAVIIDSLGLFGLEKVDFHYTKIIGLALLAIGGKLMLGE